MSEPALTRVTVNLPADQVKKIKELAQAEGTMKWTPLSRPKIGLYK